MLPEVVHEVRAGGSSLEGPDKYVSQGFLGVWRLEQWPLSSPFSRRAPCLFVDDCDIR
jgi:hypothetical protein